jgi:hypothetical protein
MFFSYHNPERTVIVTDITPEFEKWINHSEYDYVFFQHRKGSLVYGEHSDENPRAFDLKANIKSEQQFKAGILKDVQKVVAQWKSQNSWEEDFLCDTLGDYVSSFGFDDWDSFDDIDPKKLANSVISWIEDSYIDGDSSAVMFIFDVEKQEMVLGGSVNLTFYTADEWMKEMVA